MQRDSTTLVVVMCLALSACGDEATEQGEDYGDILQSPEALVLTQEEHERGWGKSECTLCHNLNNIHLENRSTTSLDMPAIHDQALDEGIASCATCHGTNGIP